MTTTMWPRSFRVSVLLVVAILVSTLIACGGGGSNGPNGPSLPSGQPSAVRMEVAKGDSSCSPFPCTPPPPVLVVTNPNPNQTYPFALDVQYTVSLYVQRATVPGRNFEVVFTATGDNAPVTLLNSNKSEVVFQFAGPATSEGLVRANLRVGGWHGPGQYVVKVRSTETGSDISPTVIEFTLRIAAS